jgi:hypothetical protein
VYISEAMALTRAYPLPMKWDIYLALNPLRRAMPFPSKSRETSIKIDSSDVEEAYV